jgi:hypothetical protein
MVARRIAKETEHSATAVVYGLGLWKSGWEAKAIISRMSSTERFAAAFIIMIYEGFFVQGNILKEWVRETMILLTYIYVLHHKYCADCGYTFVYMTTVSTKEPLSRTITIFMPAVIIRKWKIPAAIIAVGGTCNLNESCVVLFVMRSIN